MLTDSFKNEKKLIEKQYSELLFDPEFTRLELLLGKANIFSALKIVHYENRHSNFLGWLLDPKQSHGLGTKFLRLFMIDIFKDERVSNISVADISLLNLENAKIHREWNNIDLLIQIDKYVVVIENKVWSGEHSNQLQRYKQNVNAILEKAETIFVFLSPNGLQSSMRDVYVNYSYERIVTILELILNVYLNSIPQSVGVYLNDYIEILKNNFMGKSESNELARKIYNNHKDLFDFIIKNTPNPLKELTSYLDGKVKVNGWQRCKCERYFIRFVTPKLGVHLPKDGTSWGKECFLFEFKITHDKLIFYCTIGPGKDTTRRKLKEALNSLTHQLEVYREEDYMVYEWYAFEMGSEMNLSDSLDLDTYLQEFWKHVNKVVNNVEQELLKVIF
jgi:hypothetical protein